MKAKLHRGTCRQLFGNLIVRNKRSTIVTSLIIVLMFVGWAGAIESMAIGPESGSTLISGDATPIVDIEFIVIGNTLLQFASEPESGPTVLFEELPCPENQIDECVPGDVDCDGDVDSDDAELALALVVGKIQQKSCYLPVVDVAPIVDGESQPDGKIDVADAAVIMQMAEDGRL